MRRTAVVVMLAGLAACNGTTAPEPLHTLWVWVPDSLATLTREGYSGFATSSRFAVTDPVSWAQTWAQIYRGRTPEPALPAVDFGSYVALVAAMGSRPTGGFSIRIDSLTGTEAGAVLHLTETSPGPNCVVTAAVTAPIHVVLTPGPVQIREWRVQEAVLACD